MSSASSYPHCTVEINPSVTLRAVVTALLLLAALAPWLTRLHFVPAVLLSLAAVVAAAPLLTWARGELTRIHWHGNGRWLLLDKSGGQHEADRLLPGIVISAPLIAVSWRCENCGKLFRAGLLPDNCDFEARRKMQVRLRLASDEELFAGRFSSASE